VVRWSKEHHSKKVIPCKKSQARCEKWIGILALSVVEVLEINSRSSGKEGYRFSEGSLFELPITAQIRVEQEQKQFAQVEAQFNTRLSKVIALNTFLLNE
jgi:hypothetical protein